ncbi:MAG: hypothetical protein R3C12_22420 [Planctomycetaceae bacterium]
MMLALDADGDGKISAAELASTVNALKALDKNNDGELTMEEIMPPAAGAVPASVNAAHATARDGALAISAQMTRTAMVNSARKKP